MQETTSPGLDLFVSAWLERWQSFGGTVFLDLETGRTSSCFPMPGQGGRPPIEGEGYKRDWTDGFEHGRIRELHELMQLVPGATDALADHIKRFPNYHGANRLGI